MENITITITEQEFIQFLRKQGIIVKTNTQARGNLGFYLKNRIDVSKKADQSRRLAILAHEYAHKINHDMDKEQFNKGSCLKKLFNITDISIIEEELKEITQLVDENAKFLQFHSRKKEIFQEIKSLENIIKAEYPDFKRSEKFKPINVFFRKNKSPAKYLLKYDNIKIVQPVFKKETTYRVSEIDENFKDIPETLRAYIKLKSKQREYLRLYRRKNKAENYYRKPTELFARFVESLFLDQSNTLKTAPLTYSRFFDLLDQGYYGNLKNLLQLSGINR